MKKRLPFYEISSSSARSIKTFDGKTYRLRGNIAVEDETKDIQRVADIYYRVRTVVDDERNIIAKRTHEDDELTTLYRSKRK